MAGFVLAFVFIGVYWKWFLAAAVIALLVRTFQRAQAQYNETLKHKAELQAELVARADQQHQWVLEDDQRGTYGLYPPAAVN